MRIRWLLRAVEDLEDIRDYIALDNPFAAQKEVEKILDSVSGLGENPGVGRIGRVSKTREFVIPKSPYIAVYRVMGDVVEILRVLHGARKWPKRF